MPKVIIYSKTYCPFCVRAKNLFKSKGVAFDEVMMDDKPEDYAKLKERTGWMTVPQIFINDQFIGGYDDLATLDRNGKLDPLLK
jgi:glutaredoxin 3